jgi:hypothetical protein
MKLATLFVLGALAPLAHAAPTRYPLPRNALGRPVATVYEDDVLMTLQPVNEHNWARFTGLKTRLTWEEPTLLWGIPGQRRDLVLPLVPLPSLQVTLENHGAAPLSFRDADLVVTDGSGQRYPVAVETEDYQARVLSRLLTDVAELWNSMLPLGPVTMWPPYLGPSVVTRPILALAAAAHTVPLLGREVEVAPGERWSGALVVDVSAGSLHQLADLLRGELTVRLRNVRVGERRLDERVFTFALDAQDATGEPVAAPCLQSGEDDYRRVGQVTGAPQRLLDGTRVTRTDAEEALLGLAESRRAADKARTLRAVGYTLMGAGFFGAAGAAAGIAGAGESQLAPAGLAVLGVTGVGAILNYVGWKRERTAIRQLNDFAQATGACAPPL